MQRKCFASGWRQDISCWVVKGCTVTPEDKVPDLGLFMRDRFCSLSCSSPLAVQSTLGNDYALSSVLHSLCTRGYVATSMSLSHVDLCTYSPHGDINADSICTLTAEAGPVGGKTGLDIPHIKKGLFRRLTEGGRLRWLLRLGRVKHAVQAGLNVGSQSSRVVPSLQTEQRLSRPKATEVVIRGKLLRYQLRWPT
jgi:hypothetical protein